MNVVGACVASMVLFWITLLPAQAGTPAGPAAVTEKVYRTSLHLFEGFDGKGIARLKPWLTEGLYARLEKKLDQPVPPGDAPDIEGDVFLDCQDPPDTFHVGTASIESTRAKVPVDLLWPGEKRHLVVLLKQVNGAWKIDDVLYGKDGTLSDLLK